MGLFKRKKTDDKKILTQNFDLLQNYSPIYTTYEGGLYEMHLIRSAIDTIATQCSKLNPVLVGNKNYKEIQSILKIKPNSIMTMQQFLYKLITILYVENNAYIVPIYEDKYCEKIIGIYPVRAIGSRIVEHGGTRYLIYKINNVEYAEEYERVGHLKRFFYKNEINGESNSPLKPTCDLIHTQEEGIKSGIKSSAIIRFLARLNVVQNPDSLRAEQKRLKENQLSSDNNGGILLFDNKYDDVKQVDSKPFIVDETQMRAIENNVFEYFHVSEEILTNKASEDNWNLFYEAVIEPVALQLSEVLTHVLILPNDIKRGFSVMFESTKLQFMSNKTKLEVSTSLFDRGILCTNQVMDIWNLPHVEDGDKRYIRKEYTEVINLDKNINGGNDGKENNQSGDGESDSNEVKEDN